ncbi:hypothetical protein psal_cds_882 [Pandoravirus salinus]|uniref:Uncharacterized protein n=1 Tax=Pandoravirus salinus TaxID=1349410 RepID=S4VZM9_9VIRU|nr:hypothetical protein psal_cds_882 [Pandoravirus salinus]AGO84961.1 hypothetical protein psal_cds_882 [Pandoravirus salinus]
MESRQIRRPCASPAAPRQNERTSLARACLCVYLGVASVAALAEAFWRSTRGSTGPVTTCRGTGLWSREPEPPTPGSSDSAWSSWPLLRLLAGLGAGALWPLWAAAIALKALLRQY